MRILILLLGHNKSETIIAQEQEMKMNRNIPNILSFCRIPLAFVFIFAFFGGDRAVALTVLLLSVFTDIADGFVARAFGFVSDLGRLLDPSADKFMQCTVLSCLCVDGLVPVWLTAVYIVKEIVMIGASLVLLERSNSVVSSNFFGKAATVLFYCIVAAILLVPDLIFANAQLYLALCLVIAVSSVGAAVMYYVRYRKKLSDIVSNKRRGSPCD